VNDGENATLAVVVSRLDDLRGDFASLRDELRRTSETSVTRNEWLQRNGYVDGKFDDQGKDISDLRAELAGKRAPWWTIVAVVTSCLALGWTIFGDRLIAG